MAQNSIAAVDVASFLVELVLIQSAKPDQLDFTVLRGLCCDYEVIELELVFDRSLKPMSTYFFFFFCVTPAPDNQLLICHYKQLSVLKTADLFYQ